MNLDNIFEIDQLPLNYPACEEEFYGETFIYSIYFDKSPTEQEIKSVSDAINQYDFNLVDDDYKGFINVSEADGKVEIYLDLGNTNPKNEKRILYGILLALNNVSGIKNVIVNEKNGDY